MWNMKKLGVLAILIITVGIGVNMLVSLPVHFYQEAITNGVESPYLNLKKLPKVFYQDSEYKLSDAPWLYEDENQRWKVFHFVNFKVPFPIRHPLYLVVPEIKMMGKETKAGYKLLNNSDNKKVLFEFFDLDENELRLDFETQKLFQLPIFKNYILNKSVPSIWRDIFKMSFTNDPFLKEFGFMEKAMFWKMPYQEMVYRLFILHMRMKVFPEDIIKYGFYDSNSLGIVEVVDKKTELDKMSDQRDEIIFIRNGNRYFRVKVAYVIDDKIALTARDRILEKIALEPTTLNSSNRIFNEYQTLPYKRKIDQEGMVYLYNAWSHEQSRKEFMEKMIQFLERGKQDNSHLYGLYQYSFSKYGTNFSRRKGNIKETQEEKLKRKIGQELEDKIYKEKQRNEVQTDGKFEDNDAQINFYLRQAKDAEEDTSEKEDVLEMK